MSRLIQLVAAIVAGTFFVAVIALAAGFRLPTPAGAAPGGTAALDVPPTSQPSVEWAAPVPPIAVDDGEEPPLSPDVPAQPPTSECVRVMSSIDRAPMTLQGRVKIQDGAVLATVLEVGPAQWNTSDGRPPSDIQAVGPSDVMRLVRLSADHVWSGDIDDTFTATVVGGTIGCWTFASDEVPEVVPGKQFAVFLRGSPDRAGLEEVRATLTLWTVDQEGRIVTPEDGRLTVADFSQRFEQLNAE